MATRVDSVAGPIIQPKGYPLTIIIGELDTKYLCSSCKFILRKPVQSFCGHRFCRGCIDFLVNRGGVECPACIEEHVEHDEHSSLQADQVFPDNAIKREFNTLRVRCVNTGCDWEGLFKIYTVYEQECNFRLVLCVCGKDVAQNSLANHRETECPARKVNCELCLQEFTFAEELGHKEVCPKIAVACPQCGKEGILREEMAHHQDQSSGQCSRKRVQCNYGCQQFVDKNKIEEHNRTCAPQHLERVAARLAEMESEWTRVVATLNQVPGGAETQRKVQEMRDRMQQLEGRLAEIPPPPTQGATAETVGAEASTSAGEPITLEMVQQPQTVSDMRNSLRFLNNKLDTFETILAVFKHDVEMCFGLIEDYDRQRQQDQVSIQQLDAKIKNVERQVALKDVALAEQDLRIQSLQLTSYEPVFIWKIQDIYRKRQDAISGRLTNVYSPHFYTSKTGYKMCCRLYLNGDGMGRGTHVSLFFVIMRHHYDALLKWPFKQKVTMMVLDQNHRQHVIDAFRPDPTSSSFKRPTTDMNIASGSPLFMPLTDLDSTQHAYVKDDNMFVKIIIDMDDYPI